MMLFEKIDKQAKNIIFVYMMCPSSEEARAIGLSAIKEHLAISVDYWSINSIYPWQNVIQEGSQYLLLFATQKELGDNLMKHIEAEHSYSVPVIIKTETLITNQAYHFWADLSLASKDKLFTQTEDQKKKNDERRRGF